MHHAAILFALAVIPMAATKNTSAQTAHAQTTSAEAVPAHVQNSFHFTLEAPLQRSAPLFGPEGERCWAGDRWDPHFLHPQPARDIEGAVFTVQHGPHRSVWVNTLFDLAAGRIQYVAFIPDALVSTIDVRLTASAPATTRVDVTYTRTALNASANHDVEAMGLKDRASGPEWRQSIATCLNHSAAAQH